MPQSVRPIIEARREQMFQVIEPEEIDRLARFGERRSYAAGDRIVATGEIAPGAFVILRGRVDITQRGRDGQSELIVTHGVGSFQGELAQLSDRPSLVDTFAREAVEAIGDVRAGSIKRVAAAVGEGAQVVAAVHGFLAEAGDKDALLANIGRL
jgi:thioredoxin reductase (NADPH)